MKTMMLDFINKDRKMFRFKTIKIFLLAAINSTVPTPSLLINLYTLLLLKIYGPRRQLDILIKDAIISRNMTFEKIKQLKTRYVI